MKVNAISIFIDTCTEIDSLFPNDCSLAPSLANHIVGFTCMQPIGVEQAYKSNDSC